MFSLQKNKSASNYRRTSNVSPQQVLADFVLTWHDTKHWSSIAMEADAKRTLTCSNLQGGNGAIFFIHLKKASSYGSCSWCSTVFYWFLTTPVENACDLRVHASVTNTLLCLLFHAQVLVWFLRKTRIYTWEPASRLLLAFETATWPSLSVVSDTIRSLTGV